MIILVATKEEDTEYSIVTNEGHELHVPDNYDNKAKLYVNGDEYIIPFGGIVLIFTDNGVFLSKTKDERF